MRVDSEEKTNTGDVRSRGASVSGPHQREYPSTFGSREDVLNEEEERSDAHLLQ